MPVVNGIAPAPVFPMMADDVFCLRHEWQVPLKRQAISLVFWRLSGRLAAAGAASNKIGAGSVLRARGRPYRKPGYLTGKATFRCTVSFYAAPRRKSRSGSKRQL